MEIKNRLFTYPVLCGDTDDYSETTQFEIEQDISETVHEVIFKYDFNINCDALDTLLRKGEVEYVLHIECSATAFRIALKSEIPHISYRLDKSKVNGEVKLVAMLVARKNINKYVCADLNEDYIDENISFKKGAILAYHNLPPVYVNKKTDKLANNESFFTIVKKATLEPDEILPMEILLNDHKIKIIVDPTTYDNYIRFQNMHSLVMAMLVYPALIFAVEEIRENPQSYANCAWFQKLSKYYASMGKDFIEDVINRDESAVYIAQEMLNNPISRAYREMSVLEV